MSSAFTYEEASVVQTASRRERVRAATATEIKQTARKLLVEQGSDAVTLRAIAREIGMTAPALYRYFGSHEELVRNVVGDIFYELAHDLTIAIHGAADSGGGMADKLVAACREFRSWGLAHKAEFGMVFGTPLAGIDVDQDDFTAECGRRFGGTFLALFLELWERAPFPVAADEDIDPALLRQLEHYRGVLGADIPGVTVMPLGGMLVFLRCWVRLYGAVSLEVFGHLKFALDDAAPMFELTLSELAELLGLEYPGRG
jgi:AcrR family transcriptional regulator